MAKRAGRWNKQACHKTQYAWAFKMKEGRGAAAYLQLCRLNRFRGRFAVMMDPERWEEATEEEEPELVWALAEDDDRKRRAQDAAGSGGEGQQGQGNVSPLDFLAEVAGRSSQGSTPCSSSTVEEEQGGAGNE